ncbi:MAG TPA: HAD family phosphatase [Chitinophagaceae bacterium]|jgi:beta-phosphoglucomutase family hydrolase|nr:HAD family phosphatase [Chitinophagaceae bacterium]
MHLEIKNYKAFLFDLNGTMINDMPYHITAWHRILNKLGANISLERMKEECYGKNHELLERIFPRRFSEEEKNKMSLEKEKQYQQEFKPYLKLIDGLEEFLKNAHDAGIKLGIGSAAILFNIDFVLDGLGMRKYFDAIVSADDVTNSKPDPETWLKCAEKLKLHPRDCLVFEDTPKGAESALSAGMKLIIITNLHKKEEFSNYGNVIGFIDDYNSITVNFPSSRPITMKNKP